MVFWEPAAPGKGGIRNYCLAEDMTVLSAPRSQIGFISKSPAKPLFVLGSEERACLPNLEPPAVQNLGQMCPHGRLQKQFRSEHWSNACINRTCFALECLLILLFVVLAVELYWTVSGSWLPPPPGSSPTTLKYLLSADPLMQLSQGNFLHLGLTPSWLIFGNHRQINAHYTKSATATVRRSPRAGDC